MKHGKIVIGRNEGIQWSEESYYIGETVVNNNCHVLENKQTGEVGVYKYITEPKEKKLRVKKASEIVKWFEDNGWRKIEEDERIFYIKDGFDYDVLFIHSVGGKSTKDLVDCQDILVISEWLEEA